MLTILICSVGAAPLRLTFGTVTGDTRGLLHRALETCRTLANSNEVYALRMWEREELVYEAGGD